MPKLGMEPLRRAALVQATISELAEAGSLDVTVGKIAKRAGVSSGLAHHYFGGKDDIFVAAMRHILSEFRLEVLAQLRTAHTPTARVHAIIDASFAPASFQSETINAWMLFYSMARANPKAARLLRLYHRRMRTHLRHALRPVSNRPEADAETLAALIDGLYLRAALTAAKSPSTAAQHAHAVVDALLTDPAT
ncbi:MAG: transcriptional regulator BetI [Paracoccaceae bacterium]